MPRNGNTPSICCKIAPGSFGGAHQCGGTAPSYASGQEAEQAPGWNCARQERRGSSAGLKICGGAHRGVLDVPDEGLDAAPVLEAELEEVLDEALGELIEELLAEELVDPSAPCNVEVICVSTRWIAA